MKHFQVFCPICRMTCNFTFPLAHVNKIIWIHENVHLQELGQNIKEEKSQNNIKQTENAWKKFK